MKKYPVFYKNNTYGVAWYEDLISFSEDDYYVVLYKKKKFCKENIFSIRGYEMNKLLKDIQYDPSEEYVQQAKIIVEKYEKSLLEDKIEKDMEIQRKTALEQWDGVVK